MRAINHIEPSFLLVILEAFYTSFFFSYYCSILQRATAAATAPTAQRSNGATAAATRQGPNTA
jgi:hypothetical protein